MAARQPPKQVVFTPVDEDDIIDAEFADPKTQEELDFEKFRDEMRDSTEYAKYTVARLPTDSKGRQIGKQLMQMFECGIEDYTFSQLVARIRDDYGTGVYKITARKANGHFGFQQTIGIEAPKSDRQDNPQAGAAGELLDTFSLAIERQQARMEAMFKALSGPRTGGDAFEQITQMMTAMGTMMGSMGMTPQQPKSLVDQLTEFKLLQELFAGDGDGAGGEANMYSLLTETVKNFGPLLGAAITAQTKTGAIPLAGPVPALAAPAAAKAAPDTLADDLEAMRPQISFLIGQAKLGANPADVAGAIMPGIPDAALESIEAFLQKEDCIDICVTVDAQVNSYRAWFQQWREAMLQRLDELLSASPEPDDTETLETVPGSGELPPVPEMPESTESSDLTAESPGEQNSAADVAGDNPKEGATDEALSATTLQDADDSDADGPAIGDSGDAGDS